MDETIITNWNKDIKQNDIVWHLGDFAWRDVGFYKRRLNGRINLILGNHDYKKLNIRDKNLFNSIQDIHEFKYDDNKSIILCHYAMRVWNKSHFGSFHLFGHSHGKLQPFEKSVDVGIDSPWITGHIEYRPFNLEEIIFFKLTGKRIGMFRDSINNLEKAIKYLKDHNEFKFEKTSSSEE